MIHTIGDSHCGGVTDKPKEEQAFAQIPGVITHWLGPKLMFSIGRDGLDISNFSISDNDTLIFCFGEIDCRCHVHKYKENYKEVIENIVRKFFNVLLDIRNKHPHMKLCVFNVPPTIKKGKVNENPAFPYLGTDEERKEYVNYMNYTIKKYCNTSNIVFFDVYDKYCCNEGFLDEKLSDNNVHISNPKYISEFIIENNI